MVNKRNGKSIEVLVEEAKAFHDKALQIMAVKCKSGEISDKNILEHNVTYQLHCQGLNSIDSEHPLSKEDFKELKSHPGEFLYRRWKKLCAEGKPEQVIEELEMQSSLTGDEKLAQILALCITRAGPSETDIPFPDGFQVEQNPLKAAHHLAENYKIGRLLYQEVNPENIHSEAIRLLSQVLQEAREQQKNTESYKQCRKLMHDLSEGVSEGLPAMLEMKDPVECTAIGMLFRAQELIRAGNVKKGYAWLRKLTDLEIEHGDAPICDSMLFSRVIEVAKRWKKDCYDPGHNIRDLFPDDCQPVVLNFGPQAVPKQACAVCGSDKKLLRCPCKAVYYCGTGHQRADWKKHKKTCAAISRQ